MVAEKLNGLKNSKKDSADYIHRINKDFDCLRKDIDSKKEEEKQQCRKHYNAVADDFKSVFHAYFDSGFMKTCFDIS